MNDTRKAQQLLNSLLSSYDAKIKASQANAVDEIRSMKIDLSKGRTRDNPLKISFPFKNVRIEEATDVSTWVRLIPENNDQGRADTILRLKDNFKSEFGFSCCYLYWDAQPNKEIVIKFFTTSEIENGSLLLDQNNANNTITVGEASLENDELTVITSIQSSFLISNQMDYRFLTENHERYNRRKPAQYGPDWNHFVVPQGYDLHISSGEFVIAEDIVNNGQAVPQIMIFAVPFDLIDPDVYPVPWSSYKAKYAAVWPASYLYPPSFFKEGRSFNTLNFTDQQLPGQPTFGVVPENHAVLLMVENWGDYTKGCISHRIAGRLVKKVG